jgi:hypothetical protein
MPSLPGAGICPRTTSVVYAVFNLTEHAQPANFRETTAHFVSYLPTRLWRRDITLICNSTFCSTRKMRPLFPYGAIVDHFVLIL